MFFPADPLTWLLLAVISWLVLMLLIICSFSSTLLALWREPVLRHPVLIVESDDWGAGPLEQTGALHNLIDTLSGYRDHQGHPALMTLAVVLSVADGNAVQAAGKYQRLTLEDPIFSPLLEALQSGVEKGVFALQLHGMEHYWPPSLMASRDANVQEWLRQETPQATEQLPAHLQSRWIDAVALPSKPLPENAIRAAVQEELVLYRTLFGATPKVVVPPTFVWTDTVEQACATEGIKYVVTPGLRNNSRDAQGEPSGSSNEIRNGQTSFGLTYIVRDTYFEPVLGHTAETALTALRDKTRLARPCLLETHRKNFIEKGETAQRACLELSRLLHQALHQYPKLLFISTEHLGKAFNTQDSQWVEHRLSQRLMIMARRIAAVPRLGKLARMSGLSGLMRLGAKALPSRTSTA